MKETAKSLGIYSSAPAIFGKFSKNMLNLLELKDQQKPIIEFTKHKIKHELFEINEKSTLSIQNDVGNIDKMYIADGHHRFKTYSKIAQHLNDTYFPTLMYP